MTLAQYLANLPEPIQEHLVAIVREAIGMTGEEKGYAAALFATVGQHFGIREHDPEFLPGAVMVTALGALLKCANDEATKEAA